MGGWKIYCMDIVKNNLGRLTEHILSANRKNYYMHPMHYDS